MTVMRAYVGVTDWDWYRFLHERAATEVNFWQPSARGQFNAIPRGGPFLFKTNYAHGNRVVGGGFLSGWVSLPMLSAWEFFGEANGCATLADMRVRIQKYRTNRDGDQTSREVGCIMLHDVRFFEPDQTLEAPPGWKGTSSRAVAMNSIRPRAATSSA
jgi:putative restriction endonuclease